VLRLIPVAAD